MDEPNKKVSPEGHYKRPFRSLHLHKSENKACISCLVKETHPSLKSDCPGFTVDISKVRWRITESHLNSEERSSVNLRLHLPGLVMIHQTSLSG